MFQFDARTVTPQTTFEPLPSGWYKVVIRKSNIGPTQSGENGMLTFQTEVIEGPKQSYTWPWNLNLFNKSQQTVEIAYKTLSAICHVTGQFQIAATNQQDNQVPMLHNIPFMILVQPDGQYNQVRGIKDVYGNDPGKAPQQQQQHQPQPQPQPGAAQGGWQAPAGATGPAQGQGGAPAAGGWQAPGAGGPAAGQGSWQAPGTGGSPALPGNAAMGGGAPAGNWQQGQGGAPGNQAPWQRT